MTKTLELKVTVSGDDPDAELKKMLAHGQPKLYTPSRSVWQLDVTKVERADGQPVGAEAEFAQYWAELHGEGEELEGDEKMYAHDAFMYGITFGRKDRA